MGEHFAKIERELLAVVYENKENVIRIKDKNIQNKNIENTHYEKKKISFAEENEKNFTVIQNRVIERQQFHSKTTEKYVEHGDRLIPFSSIKKS